VIRELPASQTGLAFPPIQRIRPQLRDVEDFVDRVNHVLRPDGYRLIAAFDGERPDPHAVAGFRHLRTLAYGNHLQVDDLAAMPWASAHDSGELHDWLLAEAGRLGCTEVHIEARAERTDDAHQELISDGYRPAAQRFSRSY
jgi:hypothetical protein